ncbi:MAG: phosphoribosyltransferase family protein [Sulfurovum sp.]|nr:phosphoribosyltransferase family protein [Sulfurovum sp.]
MTDKIYYGYEAYKEDLKILISKIDQPFDAILGIARGGLSMAQMLGEYYHLREVYSINTIGYEDTQKNDTVEVFNIPNLPSAKVVLIVDDIIDSGDTLIEVLAVLNTKYPQILFYTASLFYKKTAKITPTWYVKEPKGWIDFFWSEDLRNETHGINDRQL